MKKALPFSFGAALRAGARPIRSSRAARHNSGSIRPVLIPAWRLRSWRGPEPLPHRAGRSGVNRPGSPTPLRGTSDHTPRPLRSWRIRAREAKVRPYGTLVIAKRRRRRAEDKSWPAIPGPSRPRPRIHLPAALPCRPLLMSRYRTHPRKTGNFHHVLREAAGPMLPGSQAWFDPRALPTCMAALYSASY